MTVKFGSGTSGFKLGGGIASKFKRDHPFDGIEYTDNDEVDTAQEFNEIQKGFMARNKAEQERFQLATDSEYWCCLVFQSREQKEQFLRAMKWMVHGDKYIDGVKVAKSLNVDLLSVKVPYNTSEGNSVSKNLKELT
jgi:hypothetical protein